jgi:ribosomal protein L37E
MVDGKLHVMCKQCGWNTAHSSRIYSACQAMGASWKLPTNHPYAIE